MIDSLSKYFINMGIATETSLLFAKLLWVLAVALVCYIAIKIIVKISANVLERTPLERGMKSFLLSASRVSLWFVAVIIIATTLGIPVTSLVAVLSVAGLALSLSLQGILSNMFSGVTVLATRPFVVDDYVELNGVSGTVAAIGIFYTKVKTFDNKLISVPNGEVVSAKIINYSREAFRRVDMTFCASYDDTTEEVKAAIMDAVLSDDRIQTDPAPFVGISAFKDSNIEYILRVWVNNADYWDVYYGMNERLRECYAKHGVHINYNSLNVRLQNDN